MRREIAQGATWMVLFRLFDRAVGLASTVILARLLVPADFGAVAMAMSVIALIELATAFSFEIALIQKRDPQRVHYDTAWTLNVLLAAGGALVTAALAYPTAAFYGEPRLVPVMWAIGAAWLVSGFENVGIVNFRREMDFAREFRFLALRRVAAFVVTLTAALTLRSYWALVIGMAAGRVFGVLLSYAMHPFRPRFSLFASRELFGFSGWMLANNVAHAVTGRIPQFFVGRLLGAQALGAYTVGAEIAQLAYTEIVAPISRALIPGYSRLAGDLDALRRICIDSSPAKRCSCPSRAKGWLRSMPLRATRFGHTGAPSRTGCRFAAACPIAAWRSSATRCSSPRSTPSWSRWTRTPGSSAGSRKSPTGATATR
jgi:PST family polysaccharide transporter